MKFRFTANALTKTALLSALFQLLCGKQKAYLQRCEQLLAKYLRITPAQLFWFGAGRMGLYALIKALKLTANDEIIVTGYTCVVVSNAIKFTHCQIKYVDINPETLNITTSALLAAIDPVKTRMVVIAHNFGLPYADIGLIKAKYPQVLIVEDAAHALLGTQLNSQAIGTLGDASFFSFEYSKPLTCGIGGLLVINNLSLLPLLKHYYAPLTYYNKATIAKIMLSLSIYVLTATPKGDFFTRLGLALLRRLKLLYATSAQELAGILPADYPVKLAPSTAIFLYYQLRKLAHITEQKQQLAAKYHELFHAIPQLHDYYTPTAVLVRYPLVFAVSVTPATIKAIHEDLHAQGFNFGVWFNDVVHPSGSYRYGYLPGSCKMGESIATNIINLPLNTLYSPSQAHLLRLRQILLTHLTA